MEKKKFDIVVLGGGPGGYPAAIRASQLGKKTALIEGNKLGGTCLNRGCIPSKTLIAGAELYHRMKLAQSYGISSGPISLDYPTLVDRKDKTVDEVRRGLESVIASNNITLIKGYGKFVSPKEIEVRREGVSPILIEGEKIIIATGSEPKKIPAFPCDYEVVHDSTSLLDLKRVPKKLLIIGGGVIGSEFASLFHEFGTEVTIVEMLPRLLPQEADAVSSFLQKSFQKRGIVVETGTAVEKLAIHGKTAIVTLSSKKTLEADTVLIAIGRALNTNAIQLEKTGITIGPDGLIPVSGSMETKIPGIYAVGDIASKWWLAHVASHQGIIAGSNAAGEKKEMHYNAIPSVTYTLPEIGTCGLSLEAAIHEGYDATVSAFPFQALGKSRAALQTEGFAQIVFEKGTHAILGAQIVGHDASSLIAEMAVAIANELTLESITETVHAHPTVAEIWLEAAYSAFDKPLHMPIKK